MPGPESSPRGGTPRRTAAVRHPLPVEGGSLSLSAACSFGLEAVVAAELEGLGYGGGLAVENGRVGFSAPVSAVARCNLWLRSADRLAIRLGEFPAATFDELFEGVKGLAWEEFVPADARVVVTARSVKSRLTSLPACQASVKRGIIDALRRRYHRQWFPESGPTYAVDLSLREDAATLSLDTSGEGLNRRGYRRQAGSAPLRETLAAAVVLLSRWRPPRVLADPFCGSGTIPIEAALLGRSLAPGSRRSFTAEAWPHLSRRIWQEAREEARQRAAEALPEPLEILASDNDPRVLAMARDNARRAGVQDSIAFRLLPVQRFHSRTPRGCLACNPPYGERTGETAELDSLYRDLGQVFRRLEEWSAFVLTAYPRFERAFGLRSDRNRKLYNGNLKTYLYQYLGPLPPVRDGVSGASVCGNTPL